MIVATRVAVIVATRVAAVVAELFTENATRHRVFDSTSSSTEKASNASSNRTTDNDHPADDDHPADNDRPADNDHPADDDPVSLTASVTVTEGIALVTCRIENDTPVPRGVRLADRLDGPTMPPRREGEPVEGWDDSEYATVVAADSEVAVGYACPVGERAVPDPPAELVAVGDPEIACHTDENLVAHAQRTLGAYRPPRDAVPVPDQSSADAPTALDSCGEDASEEDTRPTAFADGIVPTRVAAYLDAAEERVARAEGTTDGSVTDITAALRDSHHTPVTLEQAVARDEGALREISKRAEALAERAAAADVPVDTLRRLA